jgi:membrane protein DedA with SNARE-associated domain
MNSSAPDTSNWKIPRLRWIIAGGLAAVVVAWVVSAISSAVANVDLDGIDRPYAIVFMFVAFDAIIPIFPSESLLNTGSILATSDGSSIEIWRLIVAGSVGAIIGDSVLYWISRTGLRSFMSKRVAQTEQNEKIAETFTMLQDQAPTLIVFGRFVPGVRFVVGASMGIARFSYPRFLLWDTIGGIAWASFACISSALISTAIGDQPIVSIIVSLIITSALLGFIYQRVRKNWEGSKEPATTTEPKPA